MCWFTMSWIKEPLILLLWSDLRTAWILPTSEVRKLVPKDRKSHLIRRAPDMRDSEHLDVGMFHEQDTEALEHS